MGQREATRALQSALEKALITAVSLQSGRKGEVRQAGGMEWRLCFISCTNSFISLMRSKLLTGPPSLRSPWRRREAEGAWVGWGGLGRKGLGAAEEVPLSRHCSAVSLSLGFLASLPSCSTLFLLAVEGKTSGTSASAIWALARGNFNRFLSEQLNNQASKGKKVLTLSWRKWMCSTFSYFASLLHCYLNIQKHECIELMR